MTGSLRCRVQPSPPRGLKQISTEPHRCLPLNIGTGIGTTIRELVETINSVTGFRGKIAWNADKPDGAMMKVLDVERMKQVLDGWVAPTDLAGGLSKTIGWYRANKAQADAKW